MKTKFVRQEEAKERKLRTLPDRLDRLAELARQHHVETTNSWTYQRLRDNIEGFQRFLREVDLPYKDHSFVITPRNVVLRDPRVARIAGSSAHQCALCLQPFGAAHVAPCTEGKHVTAGEAIFKFE
jgi:hypothetical protein